VNLVIYVANYARPGWASQVGATGYSHGVLAQDVNDAVSNLRGLADTNGLGQVTCGATLGTCTTIGAAIKP
jgi:hypothetical protein